MADDLRARLETALRGVRFGLGTSTRYGLSGNEIEAATEQLLPFVQSELERVGKVLSDWRTAAYRASHDRDQAHIMCRNTAALLRTVADRGTDVGALLAAADDLDNAAGPTAPQRCCVCQTTEHGGAAFYENHRGQLFCWPCADGDQPATTKE